MNRSFSLGASFLIVTSLAFFALVPSAFAVARYQPGETLNPSCVPTDPDCTVSSILTLGSDGTFTNATMTNATSTGSFYSSIISAISGFFTNLVATNATTTNLTVTNALGTTTLAGGLSVAGVNGLTVLQNGNVNIGSKVSNANGSLFSATDNFGGMWITPTGNTPNIVMGYKDNYIDPLSYGNIILGGGANTYSNYIYGTIAHYSAIVGYDNVIGAPNDTSTAYHTNFIFGSHNILTSDHGIMLTNLSTISGAATSTTAMILGGEHHSITNGGNYCTILGGVYNSCSGSQSYVLGQHNKVTNANTFMWGTYASSSGFGSFILTDSSFTSGSLFSDAHSNTFSGYFTNGWLMQGGNVNLGGNFQPTERLLVTGDLRTTGLVKIGGTDTGLSRLTGGGVILVGNGTAGDYSGAVVASKVGVGTTTPAYKLQVYIDSTHEGHVDANGAWAQTSDENLKKNILTLDGALDKIMQLRGVRYDWKADLNANNSANIGFIAQEVDKVFPQFVDTGSNGVKGVAYGAFTPVLLQAIKEIQTEILGFAQSITSAVGNFGSVHSDIGITTKDKVTGDYYCLYVLSGVMSSAKGTCEEINGTSTPSSLPAQASISNPDSAVSSSTLDTNSTSTPDLEVSSPSNDTSTSTTPNLEASPLSE